MKCPNKEQHMEGFILFSSQSERRSPSWWEGRVGRNTRQLVTHCVCSYEWREGDECWCSCLFHFFFVFSLGPQHMGWCYPHSGWVFPPEVSGNPLRNRPRCDSCVILNLVDWQWRVALNMPQPIFGESTVLVVQHCVLRTIHVMSQYHVDLKNKSAISLFSANKIGRRPGF